MSQQDLIARLREHSALFSSMVELIPAQYYMMNDLEEASNERFTKFHQNRSRKAPRQAIKEATKKAKRLRLDPSAQKSIQELQAESNAAEREENDETVPDAISVEKIKSVDLEELRNRLRKKLDELRNRSNPSAKKVEGKSGKKDRKTKQEIKKRKLDRDGKSTSSSKKFSKLESKSLLNSESEEKVMFSKFDFSSCEPGEWKPLKRKTDYKKLLREAEEKTKQVQDLAEVDKQKADEIQDRDKWRRAIDKAVGAKRKDNPKLLQKTIKRREKMKQQSRKKWQDQKQRLEEQKKKRQERREKHLKERIELKKAKKLGRKTRNSKKK